MRGPSLCVNRLTDAPTYRGDSWFKSRPEGPASTRGKIFIEILISKQVVWPQGTRTKQSCQFWCKAFCPNERNSNRIGVRVKEVTIRI